MALFEPLPVVNRVCVAGPTFDADAPDKAGDDAARWRNEYLTAPGNRIAGGSDEIQRTIIGERILGLPPDIRLDKSAPFSEL